MGEPSTLQELHQLADEQIADPKAFEDLNARLSTEEQTPAPPVEMNIAAEPERPSNHVTEHFIPQNPTPAPHVEEENPFEHQDQVISERMPQIQNPPVPHQPLAETHIIPQVVQQPAPVAFSPPTQLQNDVRTEAVQ